MAEGWIKLHRKILDNPVVYKDADHFTIWIYLMLNATHTEYDVIFKGDRLTLKPGQLITGRNSIATKTGVNASKVERVLKLFKSEQQIEQQTSNVNRLISIRNWCKYQISEQVSEQQVNNNRTTSEQRVNTNNKVKKEKNDNNVENAEEGSTDSKIRLDFYKGLITDNCSIALESLQLQHREKIGSKENLNSELDKWDAYCESKQFEFENDSAIFSSFRKWVLGIKENQQKKSTKGKMKFSS